MQEYNKLEGFPKLYSVSLNTSEDRRIDLLKACRLHCIDVEIMKVPRFPACNSLISGNMSDSIQDNVALGVTANHIRMIRKWLNETSDESAVFCEDDLSFETVGLWDFTWQDFMNSLPYNWGVIQLCSIRQDDFEFGLTNLWTSMSWGANCYLMKRDFAEELVDRVCSPSSEDSFEFNMDEIINDKSHMFGLPEDVIYIKNGSGTQRLDRSYTCPMFIETMSDSVVRPGNINEIHRKSHARTLELLKNKHSLGFVYHGHC